MAEQVTIVGGNKQFYTSDETVKTVATQWIEVPITYKNSQFTAIWFYLNNANATGNNYIEWSFDGGTTVCGRLYPQNSAYTSSATEIVSGYSSIWIRSNVNDCFFQLQAR